jgi:Domain of unknown function DUF1828
MKMNIAEEIKHNYLKWISDNTRIFQNGENHAISTPFLNTHNDHIEIYIETLANNKILLHDGGETIEDLKWQGVDLDGSPKRQKMLEEILRSYGVKRQGNRIETIITQADAGIRKHFLVQSILAINDMYMLSQSR